MPYSEVDRMLICNDCVSHQRRERLNSRIKWAAGHSVIGNAIPMGCGLAFLVVLNLAMGMAIALHGQ